MFSRIGVLPAAVAVLYCVSRVNAQSPAWGQCGGIGWSGATTCVTGYTCTVTNAYYSQCVPGAASATATPTTPATSTSGAASGSSSATSTSTGSTPTGSQIRSDQDPTYHFYLQNSNGVAVLGPEDTSGYFTLGTTISLPSSNGTVYLNVDTTGTASYQTLSFGSLATTTDWGLEGDTIITTNPRQLNFLACATNDPDVYTIFLQTGNDEPSGQTCSLTSLHLDCLC